MNTGNHTRDSLHNEKSFPSFIPGGKKAYPLDMNLGGNRKGFAKKESKNGPAAAVPLRITVVRNLFRKVSLPSPFSAVFPGFSGVFARNQPVTVTGTTIERCR